MNSTGLDYDMKFIAEDKPERPVRIVRDGYFYYAYGSDARRIAPLLGLSVSVTSGIHDNAKCQINGRDLGRLVRILRVNGIESKVDHDQTWIERDKQGSLR